MKRQCDIAQAKQSTVSMEETMYVRLMAVLFSILLGYLAGIVVGLIALIIMIATIIKLEIMAQEIKCFCKIHKEKLTLLAELLLPGMGRY